MTVRKAERLLNLIVCLLETDRPVTAQQVQDAVPGYADQTWETFKRMFERDKEALREVGIPLELGTVVVGGETDEGYRIPKDRYYLPDLELAPEELAALWLAAGLVRLQDPGAARAALLKLGGDVPPGVDQGRLSWLSADLGLGVHGLARAFEAVADRKTLVFAYRGRSGEQTRTLDPYGLVHRKGAWYLVGRDHARDELRTFRLDRVAGELQFASAALPGRRAGVGPEFEPPEGFRAEQALEIPPFVVREPAEAATEALVAFDPETAWWVERTHPWLRLDWCADGSARARVPLSDASGFISWVLSLGEGVELIEPQELRGQILRRLEEACG